MPAWWMDGVEPVGIPRISHQKTASRSAFPPATPVHTLPLAVTPTPIAVQRLPSRNVAARSRLSMASIFPFAPPAFPRCGWGIGLPWFAVAIATGEESVGDVLPGLPTRIRSSSLHEELLTPIT